MTDGNGFAGPLLPPLTARLPGLASALDSELTARYLERTLLRPGGQVERAIPGALWYHPDGSCSLRYRVTVSRGTADVTEHTVMARVYPSDEAAGRSLASEEGGLTPAADPPDPWRRWTATPETGGPSLHLFPADPALPTLAAAMNLAALSGEDWPCPTADPTSVDLVHHGRQGAAVLRYGVRRTGSSPASAFDHVYGKVYPDQTTGQRVHGFLSSCANTGRVRIPESLGYSPRLNLGLTEALPGRPLLPDIVRSAARDGSKSISSNQRLRARSSTRIRPRIGWYPRHRTSDGTGTNHPSSHPRTRRPARRRAAGVAAHCGRRSRPAGSHRPRRSGRPRRRRRRFGVVSRRLHPVAGTPHRRYGLRSR